MFEHLDDPVPFVPDPEMRRTVLARGRRRRSIRRVTSVVTGLALLVATVGGAGALYVDRRDAAIDRVDIASEPSLDGATNVLVVGSDAQRGVDGRRADAILVVRAEADGSVRVLSIPRDLVDPATGERLAGISTSGPQALVDSLIRVTGVPVDHYVEVTFDGFVGLVDEAGGLDLAIDAPLRDEHIGLDLQPASCTTLDGETALALVRARHVEGDSGDIDRMARAQAVLAAAVAQLADVGPDPVTLDRYSRLLADHTVLDDELTLDRLVEMGQAVADGSAGLESTTLPVVSLPSDGSTLRLSPDAGPTLTQFGAPPTHDPASAGGGTDGSLIPTDVQTPIHPC